MTLATAAGSSAAGAWGYQARLDLSPDPASPLYDFGARPYAPGLGVFTSLDTYPGAPADPLSMNRYLYAAANPATFIDPTGHYAMERADSDSPWDRQTWEPASEVVHYTTREGCGGFGQPVCPVDIPAAPPPQPSLRGLVLSTVIQLVPILGDAYQLSVIERGYDPIAVHYLSPQEQLDARFLFYASGGLISSTIRSHADDFAQAGTRTVIIGSRSGTVVTLRRAMSQRAAEYQAQVTNLIPTSAGRNRWDVDEIVVDGVAFDGLVNGALVEAKGPGFGNSVTRTGDFYDWFNGSASLAAQAQRQVEAAGGTPIVWYVADLSAVAPIRAAIGGVPITVIHQPPR